MGDALPDAVEDLFTDTARVEPTGVPDSNAPLVDKWAFATAVLRNKMVVNKTTKTATLYADDGSTPIAQFTFDDDGTIGTRNEWTDVA